MNVSVVVGGIILLVIGAVVFGMAYDRVSELQSFVGQLARSMSPSLENEYMLDQLCEICFGLLAVGGFCLVIAGVVMKEKPRLAPSLVPPNQCSSGNRCSRCGRGLPQEDLTFCPFCGSALAK